MFWPDEIICCFVIGRCGDVQHGVVRDFFLGGGEGEEKKEGTGEQINKLHIVHLRTWLVFLSHARKTLSAVPLRGKENALRICICGLCFGSIAERGSCVSSVNRGLMFFFVIVSSFASLEVVFILHSL